MVLGLKVLVLGIKPSYNRLNLILKNGLKFRVIGVYFTEDLLLC